MNVQDKRKRNLLKLDIKLLNIFLPNLPTLFELSFTAL